MTLPKWQRNGGREFVFYHSHSGFEWEDLETTNKYQEMLCQDFQVGCHAQSAQESPCHGTFDMNSVGLVMTIDLVQQPSLA